MKIQKILLKDFRGFPGPAEYTFDLGTARHLLVYGENGSGKSSLFRAIEEFFNFDRSAKAFAEFKNIFSDPALTDGHVSVTLDDNSSHVWRFGGSRESTNPIISNIANRIGCIDYRALLRTNFLHEAETVNLFQVAVKTLLPHHPVSVRGRFTTIGKLWDRVVKNKPSTHHRSPLERATTAVLEFNEGINLVLPALEAKAQELLLGFPGCDFELGLRYPGLKYDYGQRKYAGQELFLDLSRRGVKLRGHQHFLNEARLSAIALSIYFAGLLVSVPAPPPGAPLYQNILVLDDVLIGLDMSNRIPVLELLRQRFADWQMFLLTHDKVWFEIVNLQTHDDPTWCCHELYSGESQDGLQVPIQKPCGKGWDYFLKRAAQHLADNDERAAAVYTRAAFEGKVKKYCENKGVRVKYNTDPRRIDNQSFWDAATEKALKEAANDVNKISKLKRMINEIEMYRKIVLNPLSHSATAAVVRAEIQGAIDAITRLEL